MTNQLERLVKQMQESAAKDDIQQFLALSITYRIARIEYRLRLRSDGVDQEQIENEINRYNEPYLEMKRKMGVGGN